MPNREMAVGHQLRLIPAVCGSFNKKLLGATCEEAADGKLQNMTRRWAGRCLLPLGFVDLGLGWWVLYLS